MWPKWVHIQTWTRLRQFEQVYFLFFSFRSEFDWCNQCVIICWHKIILISFTTWFFQVHIYYNHSFKNLCLTLYFAVFVVFLQFFNTMIFYSWVFFFFPCFVAFFAMWNLLYKVIYMRIFPFKWVLTFLASVFLKMDFSSSNPGISIVSK